MRPIYNPWLRIEWKPADLWIGVRWREDTTVSPGLVDHGWHRYDLWLCLVLGLSLHLSWWRVWKP